MPPWRGQRSPTPKQLRTAERMLRVAASVTRVCVQCGEMRPLSSFRIGRAATPTLRCSFCRHRQSKSDVCQLPGCGKPIPEARLRSGDYRTCSAGCTRALVGLPRDFNPRVLGLGQRGNLGPARAARVEAVARQYLDTVLHKAKA